MSREIGNAQNIERLAGVATFTPEGESGAIPLGDVTLYKPAHTQESKDDFFHPRTGVKVQVKTQVTSTALIWELNLQEHTRENDAFLLFGRPGEASTQAAVTAGTVTLSDVHKRREYDLGALLVTEVEVANGEDDLIIGTRDATGQITPPDADVVLDADRGALYIVDGENVEDGDTLTVSYSAPALTRDTIIPLTAPTKRGTLRLDEFAGGSSEPRRIITMECTLLPTAWGENNLDGDSNNFTFQVKATREPVITIAQN